MRKVIACLAISVVVSFLYWNKTLFLAESYFSDKLIKSEQEVMSEVKILAIDEESLNQIGRWPWSRDVLAGTAGMLAAAGAKAVFIDVLYTEQSENDELLAEVVNTYDNIYLASAAVMHKKQSQLAGNRVEAVYHPAVPIEYSQLGHINTNPERDGVVRNVILGVPDQANGRMLPAISVKLTNKLLEGKEKTIKWDDKAETFFYQDQPIPTDGLNEVRFTYSTSPVDDSQKKLRRTFDIQPIHRVISGEIPPFYFENSIVMIGPFAEGLQDKYMTPMSQNNGMYGIEIHANIVQSLYEGSYYNTAGTKTGIMLIFFLTTLSFLVIDRVKAIWGFLILIGFVGLYAAGVFTILNINQLLLPFFYINLAFGLVYIASVVSQYVIERREKSRVTNIFGRYVSKGVVDDILASKSDVKLGGVRKDVTLLFVDIRGFTPLSEKMEPEEVIVILNEYLDLATRAVFEYDGTLDKFMGDGVMAIFGAPIEQEDHAERAVKAALFMKKQGDDLSDKLLEKYDRTVRFGVGINSGPAVIGNIGSHDRLDYTAIGDTVNLAARLESNAKPNQVLISEDTYQLVKNMFKCEELDPIKVKGKEKMVQIYEVKE